ncbi:Uncharacterised protein [Vibrio cholerae]|nr:Uncharacterised protein [Vibrio cholerae]CSD32585.1 Uncharacterised protein [Vibrio cholerae]
MASDRRQVGHMTHQKHHKHHHQCFDQQKGFGNIRSAVNHKDQRRHKSSHAER